MQAQFFSSLGTDNIDEDTGNAVLDMVGNLAAASQDVGAISAEATTALTGTLGSFLASANKGTPTTTASTVASSGTSSGTSSDTSSDSANAASDIDPATGKPAVEKKNIDVEKVLKIYTIVDSVLGAGAGSKITGEQPTTIKNDQFEATVENASPSSHVKTTRNLTNGISFQLTDSVFDGLDGDSEIQSVVVAFKSPASLDNYTSILVTPSVRMVIKNKTGPIICRNLSQPIQIVIPLSDAHQRYKKNIFPDDQIDKDDKDQPLQNLTCFKNDTNRSLVVSGCQHPFNVSCSKYLNGTNGTDVKISIKCPKKILVYTCAFFNENTSTWLETGVATNPTGENGHIQCGTTHLTDFSVKFTTSFADVDNILVSPLDQGANATSPEEVLQLIEQNILVIITMLIIFGLFVVSFAMSLKFDSDDDAETEQQMEVHVKNIWAASRGIIDTKLLSYPVTKTSWQRLFVEGMKGTHPILSIYFTFSRMISR